MEKTIQRLCFNEGIRLSPYLCSQKKLTIGIGRCLDTNPLTSEEIAFIGHDCREKSITKEQAFYLLRHDIANVKKVLDKKLPWWKNLNEDRQYVLIDMCFQLGIKGLLGFKKMLSNLSTGFYNQAADELMDSEYARQTPARAKRNKYCLINGEYRC